MRHYCVFLTLRARARDRALFQMSALPSLVCAAVLVVFACFSSLPMRDLLFDRNLMLSGIFFAMMRHSSTVLLQVFSLLVHSLVKLSRRFFFIFLALWIAHQRPSALHVTGLMLVLCGATSMDLCSRFGRWWMLVAAYVATAVAAAVVYLSWSGNWHVLWLALVKFIHMHK